MHGTSLQSQRPFAQPASDHHTLAVASDALRCVQQHGVLAEVQPSLADLAISCGPALGDRLLAAREVLAVFSSENYSQVLTAGQRWFVRRTMSAWEALLPAEMFIRVHRTAIVNLAAVEELKRRTGETSLLRLRGFSRPIRVSRSRQLALRVAMVERR